MGVGVVGFLKLSVMQHLQHSMQKCINQAAAADFAKKCFLQNLYIFWPKEEIPYTVLFHVYYSFLFIGHPHHQFIRIFEVQFKCSSNWVKPDSTTDSNRI